MKRYLNTESSSLKPSVSTSPTRIRGPGIDASDRVLKLLQSDFKIRLSNQHHLLRAFTSVRDVGAESYLPTFQAQSFNRLSKGIKTQLPGVSLKPNLPSSDLFEAKLNSMRPVLPLAERMRRANKVQGDAELEMWVKRRKVGEQPDLRTYLTLAKNLFDALDEGRGSVQSHTLIGHILSTGLGTDPIELTSAFASFFDTRHIHTLKLGKLQFLDLFQTKKIVDHIIEILSKTVLEDRQRRSITDRGTGEKEAPIPIQWPFPSFTQSMNVLKSWWHEVNRKQIETVHIRKLSQFLAEKGIVGNKHEGKKLINASGKCYEDVYVRQAHFFSIFHSAVLKSTLLNLAIGMTIGSFKDSSSSLRLRMADYERKMMLSGLKSARQNSKEKIALHVFSAFIKKTKTDISDGFSTSKPVFPPSALIPSIAKDDTFDMSHYSSVEEKGSGLVSTDSSYIHRSFSPRQTASNRSFARFSSRESLPRKRLNQKFFRSVPVIAVPKDVRLMRENCLYKHFADMVEYASEVDRVLASCSPFKT